MMRLILSALLLISSPALAALPTSWPVGTWVHDWQWCGSGDGCNVRTSISGVDPVLHTSWNGTGSATAQGNKDAMMAGVNTFGAGLPNGRQPSQLADGTPGGGCPNTRSLSPSSLAGLSLTVDIPDGPDFPGGLNDVPLIYECDFNRAFGSGTITLSNGVWVAILHSATFGQVKLDSASTGGVISLESLHVGTSINMQGVLQCGNTSKCFIYRSEVAIASDVMKVGDNDTFIATHFHGNSCTTCSSPHPDTFQCTGSCRTLMMLDNFVDGPFRDDEQPLRLNFATGTAAGPAYVAGNLISGGRNGTGDAAVLLIGSGFPTSGFTGPAVLYGNKFLGSIGANVGISWHSGTACHFGSGVTAGSSYSSINTASDGNTSGSNGNAMSDGYGGRDDDTWTTGWDTVCDAENGSPQPTTAGQITTMDNARTGAAAVLAAAYAAAGVTSSRAVIIQSATPNTGAPGQAVTVVFSMLNFGTVTDCDIHATGANTFNQDLSTPYTPATIPGGSLSASGVTNITVECTDGTPATSLPTTLNFATPAATLSIETVQKELTGGIPLSTQITGDVTGTETGTVTVDLDETCDGTWESTLSGLTPSTGDVHFTFATPSQDAGPYSFSGNYCVRATRNGQSAYAQYSVTITGTPPQIIEVRGYDTTLSGCDAKRTAIVLADNLIVDRDSVGPLPNWHIKTTEAPDILTYSGPSCVDVVQTDPTNGAVNRDEKDDPFVIYGDQQYCNPDQGIPNPTIAATGTSGAADGVYKLVATPRDVETSGTPAACTGGNAGSTVDYDYRIGDLVIVSTTPAIPTSAQTFTIDYNESGVDCTTVMADCDGDGSYTDDVVNEGTEVASCAAQPSGLRTIGLSCTMSGWTGSATERAPLEVIPSAGATVTRDSVRILP